MAKITVWQAVANGASGVSVTHDIPGGNWVVDDNGTLHLRDANHRHLASYANRAWRIVAEEQ
jgi:hypothetical protein